MLKHFNTCSILLTKCCSNRYSILGPSGCGKTTLVHCLVGSLKPRKGLVKVFGEVPGSYHSLVPGPGVGYMPQEIGLFQEFTIEETLTFFGRLYRLPKAEIKHSIRFLLQFLDLPDKSSSVGQSYSHSYKVLYFQIK